jgi:hypothetical protein
VTQAPCGWRALASATLVGELILVRATGGPVRPGDAALSALAALAVAQLPPTPRRAAAALLLVAVSLGVVLPPALGTEAPVVMALMSALTTLIVPWAMLGDPLAGGPPARPDGMHGAFTALATLCVATVLAVTHQRAAPPDPLAWAALATLATFAAASAPRATALALAALLTIPLPRAGAPRPDVVLVTVDALRADVGARLASHRAIADAGVAYEGRADAPWTLPSLAALHTGRTDTRAGGDAATGFVPLATDVPTLAEAYAAAGYATIAVLGDNPFVGQTFGLLRGFQDVDHPRAGLSGPLPRGRRPHASPRPAVARLWPAPPPPSDAEALVDRLLADLDRVHGGAFAWLHLMDVHLPWADPPCRPDVLAAPPVRPQLLADPWWSTDAGAACLRAGHEHAAARVDAALARLIEALPPDTLVVLTADHGEALGDAGVEHGHTQAPAVTHVPLAVRAPWTPTALPVDLADVGTTLGRVAGDPTFGGARDLRGPIGPREIPEGPLLYP